MAASPGPHSLNTSVEPQDAPHSHVGPRTVALSASRSYACFAPPRALDSAFLSDLRSSNGAIRMARSGAEKSFPTLLRSLNSDGTSGRRGACRDRGVYRREIEGRTTIARRSVQNRRRARLEATNLTGRRDEPPAVGATVQRHSARRAGVVESGLAGLRPRSPTPMANFHG